MHQLLASIPPDLAQRIVDESGGVPLFALELEHVVEENPAISVLPDTLRRAIGERVVRLTDEARRILEAAAVLADGFDTSSVGLLADVPINEVVACIEDLIARRW